MIERLNVALEGRYRIERELGEGGMATVYLAEDLRHGRQVAVKVLRPELAAVVGAERFLAEIRTTAALQHPHILPLHDSGAADGFLFYVMPYVAGDTLRDRLDRERQLPVQEAVEIARKVADALEYAHEQGVIHRDIKPANILLSRGDPVVADFGIALALSEAGGGRITETGLSLGTPHYMSPEQATGERSLDPRSDIYALGCVLYEMLVGEPPFPGPTAQAVLVRILTGQPRRVTETRHTVPCARGRGGGEVAGEAAGGPLRLGRGVRRGVARSVVRYTQERRRRRRRDAGRRWARVAIARALPDWSPPPVAVLFGAALGLVLVVAAIAAVASSGGTPAAHRCGGGAPDAPVRAGRGGRVQRGYMDGGVAIAPDGTIASSRRVWSRESWSDSRASFARGRSRERLGVPPHVLSRWPVDRVQRGIGAAEGADPGWSGGRPGTDRETLAFHPPPLGAGGVIAAA
jgi:serine/threonine protein kinase